MAEIFDNNKGGKYGYLFVQELADKAKNMGTPEFQALYNKFAKRIIWIDNEVVPGAFQMNTAWYSAVPERDPIFDEHVHGYTELVGFYGTNPDDPYNLNGEIIFAIEGEEHRLTRSTLIFLPSNIAHNPMRIRRVDRPIFHFSVVMNPQYDGDDVYK